METLKSITAIWLSYSGDNKSAYNLIDGKCLDFVAIHNTHNILILMLTCAY